VPLAESGPGHDPRLRNLRRAVPAGLGPRPCSAGPIRATHDAMEPLSALIPLTRDSARTIASPWSSDATERFLPGTRYSLRCRPRLEEDRDGFTVLAPLLLARARGNGYVAICTAEICCFWMPTRIAPYTCPGRSRLPARYRSSTRFRATRCGGPRWPRLAGRFGGPGALSAAYTWRYQRAGSMASASWLATRGST